MLAESIKSELKAGAFCFQYRKVDGTIRDANGTLNPVIIQERLNQPEPVVDSKPYYSVNEVVVYYDLDANKWRSFRVDRYIGPVGKVYGNDI